MRGFPASFVNGGHGVETNRKGATGADWPDRDAAPNASATRRRRQR